MSEETKVENMFEAKDHTYRFYEILSECLEKMAENKDYHGGLELIKFIRRFVPDVPVTDYRTVGEPESIIKFMELCGLSNGNDYKVEVSSLDPTSHVLSMLTSSNKTTIFLNNIAGLRVNGGPSTADRLYCEFIKESGNRNFLNILVERPGFKSISVKKYIIDRTLEVYTTLSKLDITKDGTPDEVKKIVEFARSQISGDKLFQTSIPFVPLAVAELFFKIIKNSNKNKKLIKYPVMFELDADPSSFVAARPIEIESDLIPLVLPLSAPIKMLRKLSEKFDRYMAKDAYSFIRAPGNSGALVVVNSKMKFIRNTPEETLKSFNMLRSKYIVMNYINEIYKSIYESLNITFDARSDVFVPASSDLIEKEHPSTTVVSFTKKAIEKEKENGFVSSKEDPTFMLMASFVISPFMTSQPVDALFDKCYDQVSSVVLTDDIDKKDTKVNISELWFEAIHGFKVPPTETALDLSSLERNIINAYAKAPDDTPAEKVKVAVAKAIRTWIREVQINSYEECIKNLKITNTIKDADPNGLHSPNSYVTQIVTTVTGKTSKSIADYANDVKKGRCIMAPYVNSSNKFMYNIIEDRQFVTSYLNLAVCTDMQAHNVKTANGFTISLETNFDVNAIDDIRREAVGNPDLLRYIRSEIIDSLLSRILTKERSDNILGKIPEGGIIHRTLNKIKDQLDNDNFFIDLIDISIRSDLHGRAVVMITLSPSIAFLIMADNYLDSNIDSVVSVANTYDSKLLTLPKEQWREKIAESLIEKCNAFDCNYREHGYTKFNCMCSGIISASFNIDERFIGNYNPSSMFNLAECSKEFSRFNNRLCSVISD